MKNNKIVTGAIMGMLLAPMVLGTGQTVLAASVKDLPIAEVPSKNSSVDEKYDVSAEFIKGKTKMTSFGGKTIQARNEGSNVSVEAFVNPSDNLKGKIGFIYEPSGLFDGKKIALKVTYLDWHKAGFKGGEWLGASTGNSIGEVTGGYGYTQDQLKSLTDAGKTTGVKMSLELINPETGKPVKEILGNFLNINDIDALQSVIFDEATTKNIEKLYVADNTWVEAQYLNNNKQLMLSAPNNELSGNDDEFAMVTSLFNGNKVVFDWTKDYSSFDLSRTLDPKKAEGPQYFSYTNKKLARTEMSTPTKLVDGKESNTINNYLQHFTYDITHHVANEKEQFYFKDYALVDKIIPELDINSVKVTNEKGEDVSSFFKNETKGNDLKYVATKEALKNPKFYGHDYKFTLDVSIKKGADLSKYADKNGNIKLPNTAKVIVNGKEKPTEEVITNVPPLVVNKQHKSILDKDGKEVDKVTLKKGDKATFKLDFDIANNKELIGFSDDLEDVLDLEKDSYKVLDKDGKEITDQFKVTIDEKTEKITVTPKDPKKFSGKSISILVSGIVKDVDLDKYFNDKGEAEIPNTGFAHYKEGDEPTEKVIVVVPPKDVPKPPVVEGTQHKSILDVDGKETDLVSAKEGDEVTFKGDFEIANDKKLLNITDNLEDVLDLNEKDYTIIDSETKDDISDQFEIAMDGETETNILTPKDPESLKGKKVTVTLKATVKKGADFTDYLDDNGNIMIGNIWLVNYDKGGKETNEVHVTVPQDKPKVIPQTGGNNNVDTAMAVATVGIIGVAGTLVAIKRKGKEVNENN